MPYEWTEQDGATRQLRLWPHRSLPRRGFAAFILATFALITVPLYPLLGTALLWGLLPFVLLAVAGLWLGLERSYRDGEMNEELTLAPDEIRLVHIDKRGARKEWDCNSYWARVTLYPSGGPVENYLTLKGKGREVEIGAFLSEEERRVLHGELSEALRAARGA